ncbi:hypothetical protein CTA1_6165 [Colletotrichum tanaceti]|uniref:Uncharacterized protein n=1 Tax=Colletotrichum tanaceti TaxID=1306861 RepID=A0A4U6X3Y3_9PEZI|nr:hypothetical protein CTA1_6165 [Colletotrichum tanaceti]
MTTGSLPSRASRAAAGSRPPPSWSWASVECGVGWSIFGRWKKSDDLDVLGCHNNPSSPRSPFGEVQATDIRVRGLLLPHLHRSEALRRVESDQIGSMSSEHKA